MGCRWLPGRFAPWSSQGLRLHCPACSSACPKYGHNDRLFSRYQECRLPQPFDILLQGQLSINWPAPSDASQLVPWTCVCQICLNGPLIQSSFITGNASHPKITTWLRDLGGQRADLTSKNQGKEDTGYLSNLCLMHLISSC